ncbi:hypothetical protein [Pseudomonas sp. 22 E 5]|uniref:SMODS and SLOG-associating 2TM effector domain-containing protein n=1 Tax=Pseudomonas asgharzadehiana TaxID=2842349 RepID=A0ABX8NV25_9PSED|nr:hypothetical protein [Pseudomonas asgharzadehiana]QXH65414.1 hypothetical protein KSS96_17490 [Pseudomonas asgharzadehiana]CRM94996.1 hypothetical protein [Pseudomonas sp. 22 E 5]
MKRASDPASPTTEYFDSETLLELRESSRVYQKLDLAYLTAAGTFVTALKLSNNAIIELGAGLTYAGFAFIILLAFDTLTEQLIHKDWIESKKSQNKRTNTKLIQGCLSAQPLGHFMFISLLLTYHLGLANGITDFQKNMSTRASIQNLTSSFFYKHSRAPQSIEELIAFDSQVGDLHAKIGREPVSFKANKEKKYDIIFAGSDKILGTADDIKADGDFQIQKILDELKKH